MMNKNLLLNLFFGACLLAIPTLSFGQISVTAPSFSYTETFATNIVPAGWAFFEAGTNANAAFSTGTGTSTTGDTYFLGSSDYAFGGLQSGSLASTVGVCFTNNSGLPLTGMSVSFVGETWRVGTASRIDRMDFQLNTSTTAINGAGNWLDVDALDYANPGQATGSGSVQHTATVSNTLSGLSIPVGTTFCMRWADFNATGADDAMGIASFSLTTSALPIELANFSAKVIDSKTALAFTTATELNNAYFSIERSQDGTRFEAIGKVTGAGTSTEKQEYAYTDERPLKGTNFYRLKQVDFDGHFSYSQVVSVNVGKVGGIRLSPQPVLDRLQVALEQPAVDAATWQVYDFAGRLLQSGTIDSESTNFEISTSTLMEGTYVLRLVNGQQIITQQFQKN